MVFVSYGFVLVQVQVIAARIKTAGPASGIRLARWFKIKIRLESQGRAIAGFKDNTHT
jgi:hypothetical protein